MPRILRDLSPPSAIWTGKAHRRAVHGLNWTGRNRCKRVGAGCCRGLVPRIIPKAMDGLVPYHANDQIDAASMMTITSVLQYLEADSQPRMMAAVVADGLGAGKTALLYHYSDLVRRQCPVRLVQRVLVDLGNGDELLSVPAPGYFLGFDRSEVESSRAPATEAGRRSVLFSRGS
jgi:hypothetical protein